MTQVGPERGSFHPHTVCLLAVIVALGAAGAAESARSPARAASEPGVTQALPAAPAVIGYRLELVQLNEKEAHQLQLAVTIPKASPVSPGGGPGVPNASGSTGGGWQVQILPSGGATPWGSLASVETKQREQDCASAQLWTILGSAGVLRVSQQRLGVVGGASGQVNAFRVSLTPVRWVTIAAGNRKLTSSIQIELDAAPDDAGGMASSRVETEVTLPLGQGTPVAVVAAPARVGPPSGKRSGGVYQDRARAVRYLLLTVTATAGPESAVAEPKRVVEATAGWPELLWGEDSTSPALDLGPTVGAGLAWTLTIDGSGSANGSGSVAGLAGWLEIGWALSGQEPGLQATARLQRFSSDQAALALGLADRVEWGSREQGKVRRILAATVYRYVWTWPTGERLGWSGQIQFTGTHGGWWGQAQVGRAGTRWNVGLSVGHDWTDRWALVAGYGWSWPYGAGARPGRSAGEPCWSVGLQYRGQRQLGK